MKIKSLYREYIQKSRLFLYPLLDIKRGVSVTPIQTYMALEGKFCFSDSQFMCQYHMRNDQDFKLFEEIKLTSNPKFCSHHILNDDTGLYIFDFSKEEKDFWYIVTGQYSQISKANKNKILKFFTGYGQHQAYIESYLYPEKYYGMYSEILNVTVKTLTEARELCDKPDLSKEELILSIKIMNNKNNTLNLPGKSTN